MSVETSNSQEQHEQHEQEQHGVEISDLIVCIETHRNKNIGTSITNPMTLMIVMILLIMTLTPTFTLTLTLTLRETVLSLLLSSVHFSS
jgi:hypothetical protein